MSGVKQTPAQVKEAAILGALERHGGAWMPLSVAVSALGLDPEEAADRRAAGLIIRRLIRQGLVRRVRNGGYRLEVGSVKRSAPIEAHPKASEGASVHRHCDAVAVWFPESSTTIYVGPGLARSLARLLEAAAKDVEQVEAKDTGFPLVGLNSMGKEYAQ